MPLQFTYSERCHYNSFEPSNMPFSTYLILLDPRAGSGIFVWTKMPLLPLHPPLTYLWAPHVSIFFIFPFFPSRCRRPPPPGPSAHPPALCACPGRIVGGGEDGGRRSSAGAGAGESARLAREVARVLDDCRASCFVAAERGGAGAAVAAEQGGRERSGAAAHGASAEWRGRVRAPSPVPAEAERASSLGSAGEPRGRAVRGPRPRSTTLFGVRAL